LIRRTELVLFLEVGGDSVQTIVEIQPGEIVLLFAFSKETSPGLELVVHIARKFKIPKARRKKEEEEEEESKDESAENTDDGERTTRPKEEAHGNLLSREGIGIESARVLLSEGVVEGDGERKNLLEIFANHLEQSVSVRVGLRCGTLLHLQIRHLIEEVALPQPGEP
jgi:hypothetical protein